VGGVGVGLYPMAGFDTGCVEPSGSANTTLVVTISSYYMFGSSWGL
jgi:hypothetical protein